MADEPVTYCTACGGPIDRNDPDAKVVEKLVDMGAGFGGRRPDDLQWTAAGIIHADCQPPADHRLRPDAA